MPDIWELLNSRTKQLDGMAYKLSSPGQYAIDAEIFDAPAIDEKKMSVKFPFASGQRRDGVGDLLEIGGIRLDRHRKNPQILWDHGNKI